MASVKLGAWMSAALDDPNVCDAMKADINEWFSAGEPMELLCQALNPPEGPWSYYHDDYYGLWHVKAEDQPEDVRDVASFCTLEHAKLICRAVNAHKSAVPMKMLVGNEWLQRHVESDPLLDCEVATKPDLEDAISAAQAFAKRDTERRAAQGTEAGTAETVGLGPKDDGPVRDSECAPTSPDPTPSKLGG